MGDTIERYKNELQRIAWRIQYKARVQQKRECPLRSDFHSPVEITDVMVSDLYVKQILELIPTSTGRNVIIDFYIRDKSERQIAEELNISQQAVSKWKKKL
ncbi:hypothetical protein SAMN05444162_2547 [Paenibacillaceae bacterium GAS479]|nr:hypothetical protein SAMN05444162_2547 [Paenibacillaceae bacterium GAS479]